MNHLQTSACFSSVFIAAEANGCTHSRLWPSSERQIRIPEWGSWCFWEGIKNLDAPLFLFEGQTCTFPANQPSSQQAQSFPVTEFVIYWVFFSCHWNVVLSFKLGTRSFWTERRQCLLRAAMPAANENLGRKGKIIEPSNTKLFPQAPWSCLLPTCSFLQWLSQTRSMFTESSSPLPRHLNISKGRQETRSAESK